MKTKEEILKHHLDFSSAKQEVELLLRDNIYKAMEEYAEQGLTEKMKAEATIEFMNLFRQMLNDARLFSDDARSLRGCLIEDIEKKKHKAELFLKQQNETH